MLIPKDRIVEILNRRGDGELAQRAQQELPDPVDHDEHSDLLRSFQLDPQDLTAEVQSAEGLNPSAGGSMQQAAYEEAPGPASADIGGGPGMSRPALGEAGDEGSAATQ
jgi:hypothetical protein